MKDFTKIHALVDGQLNDADRKEVEAWIAADPDAQSEFENARLLKSLVSQECMPVTCEETWAKCKRRLGEFDRRSSIERLVGRSAWGLCAIFFVAILSAAMLNRTGSSNLKTSDVLGASLVPIETPQSQSSNENARWLRGLADRNVPLQTDVVRVHSAQQGNLNGHNVVRLDVSDAKGNMVLYIASDSSRFQDSTSGTGEYGSLRVGEASGITWSRSGMAFLLLGDRNDEDLKAVANRIQLQ
ncbi:MAG: hypothetical protein ABL949_14475 [Fimbriimonadaceae bacterium]